MAKGSWNKQQHVVPQAHQAMDNFKYEIASELGLPVKQGSEDYWGNVSSRDCGAVGGHMVRRMIEMSEQQLSGGMGSTGGTTGGSTGGTTGGTTGGSTGTGGQYGSSYSQGTTFNSGNDQQGKTTPTGGMYNTTNTGYGSSYSQGTTFNSGNDQKGKQGGSTSGTTGGTTGGGSSTYRKK